MAFIPQEDEDSNEVGMNVLAGQEQTIQQPVEQQNQQTDQQVSGGQSASIEGGQQLGSQAQPVAPTSKKQRGSGMFTDIRKYINANKSGGNRLGSAVARGIQKKVQTPAQKLAEQSKRIRQNYDAQQQALGQVQQTTQQATQQVGNIVDPQDLQAQQQRLQTRVGALGDLRQGGYQQDVASQQQAFQTFAPQIEQAQQAQQQASQAYTQAQQAQQQAQQAYQDFVQNQSTVPTYSEADLQTFMQNQSQSQFQHDRDLAQNYFNVQQNLNQANLAQQEAQQSAQARLQALQNLQGQQSAAQTELQNLQDQQARYERQQDLLGQISNIENQLGQQTELNPSNVQQITDFISGNQNFDVGTLNTLEAKRQADMLAQQAMDLETKGDVRKRLLRETFGDKYTRGMSGLDDLILARTNQIGKLQDASRQASSDIKEDVSEAQAERLGLREDLIGQADQARTESKELLESNLADMMQNLEQRAETGEGGRLGELRQALTSPEGLSQQQLEMLGGEQNLYGLDLDEAFNQAIQGQELQAGDVATATEKARIDAVRQLLAQDPSAISTVDPGEFSTAERNVFDNIRQQISERKNEYNQATNEITNNVTSGWGEIVKPIAGELSGLAQQVAKGGKMPSDAELTQMQTRNYWTHAGMGKHGWVLPIEDMKAMIGRMAGQFSQLNEDMNIQDRRLTSFTEGEAAKDGLIKRNILKRLARG